MRQRICPQPGGHAQSGEGTFKRSFTAEMMEIVVLPHRRLPTTFIDSRGFVN